MYVRKQEIKTREEQESMRNIVSKQTGKNAGKSKNNSNNYQILECKNKVELKI